MNTSFWSWFQKPKDTLRPGRVVGFGLAGLVAVVLAVLGTQRAHLTASHPMAPVYLISLASALLILWAVGIALVGAGAGAQLRSAVVGRDHRASTSKLQYVIWTGGIAFALLVLVVHTTLVDGSSFVCPDAVAHYCVPPSVWETYLILMGVPAVAAVVAKAAVTSKTQSGALQKHEASSASVADLVTDDAQQVDLVSVQYLVFNLVAFLYFSVSFAVDGTFVEMPHLLLALTSAGAASYTLNKVLTQNTPVVKSVLPDQLVPGSTAQIRGTNLLSGSDVDQLRVKVAGKAIPVLADAPKGGGLTFTVPQVATGSYSLVVVTADGTESEPYPVTV